MAKFHINSKGEAGACSAKAGKCPFGGENEHFTTAEAARTFYETKAGEALAGTSIVKKAKVTSPPKTMQEFHAALAKIPDVKDSRVIHGPAIADNQGYMGGQRFVGYERAKSDKSFVTQSEASTGLRELVKKAKATGEIPSWLDVSVRKNSGAWVSSISVVAGYKPEGGRKVRAIPEEWLNEKIENDRGWPDYKTHEPVAKLETYLRSLASSYESSDMNSMVDYHNSSNAGRFSWRSKYEDRD